MAPRKRLPTPEEKQLWQQVTKDVAMLKKREPMMPPSEQSQILVERRVALHPLPSLPSTPKNITSGDYTAMDGSSAERLRKGDYPIDATLDLHGLSRDKAYNALTVFMQTHYGRGNRCLLIITGKGAHQKASEEGGVLRQLLPRWLNEAELRPLVLALTSAKPKHGGTGAYYVC